MAAIAREVGLTCDFRLSGLPPPRGRCPLPEDDFLGKYDPKTGAAYALVDLVWRGTRRFYKFEEILTQVETHEVLHHILEGLGVPAKEPGQVQVGVGWDGYPRFKYVMSPQHALIERMAPRWWWKAELPIPEDILEAVGERIFRDKGSPLNRKLRGGGRMSLEWHTCSTMVCLSLIALPPCIPSCPVRRVNEDIERAFNNARNDGEAHQTLSVANPLSVEHAKKCRVFWAGYVCPRCALWVRGRGPTARGCHLGIRSHMRRCAGKTEIRRAHVPSRPWGYG